MENEKTRTQHQRTDPEDEKTRIRQQDTSIENDKTRIRQQDTNTEGDRTRIRHQGADDIENAKTQILHQHAQTSPPPVLPHVSEVGSQGLINNRFRPEYLLGQGGMGVVYAARDLRKEELGDDDSRIAIKLLSEEVRHLPNALRMLQQECKKAQELAHPNVVTVYDFDRDGEVVYMTMELLAGKPLDKYLIDREIAATGQNAPVDFNEAFSIITDIVQGLAYAHKRGIVHFDLKPGNIFITDDGTTKILDFGIARAIRTSGSKMVADDSELGGMIALTPRYASLEMFHGKQPDLRDDIYALAIIAYQLLAGKYPFGELSAEEVQHQNLQPERIPGLTDRQWKGLLSGLALKREDRTLSVEAFLETLLPKKVDYRYWLAVGTAATAIIASLFFWLQPPQIVAPSLFENPPPAAELIGTDKAQVEQLLEVAEVHRMIGRLISPNGANALDVYNQVLSIHPYNRQAIRGLETLLDRLAQAAELAINEGKRRRAQELIDSGLKTYPKHKQLLALQQQLIEVQP